jgi:restriction system protein
MQTSAGPDGGIDLKLRKGQTLATVQCKHWRSKKVNVRINRKQLGVMTAAGACFVVTAGEFTDAAKQFARDQPITLIDGKQLSKQAQFIGDTVAASGL